MLKQIKYWVLSLIISVMIIGAVQANPSTTTGLQNPKTVVTNAINYTFKILDRYKSNISASNTQLRNEVVEQVLPFFNTRYISAVILGPYYRSATTQQRNDFTQAVQDYMVNAYIEGLSFYHGQKVQVQDPRMLNPQLAEDSVVVYANSPITVTFKLLKRNSGDFNIIDFTAEGISFANTKATEWQPILRQRGVVGLTNYIKANSNNILGRYKGYVN